MSALYALIIGTLFLIKVPTGYKKPTFLEEIKVVSSNDDNMLLECKVWGYPAPSITWLKDGKEIRAGSIFLLLSNSLCLGTYTCKAKNCMGNSFSTLEVKSSTFSDLSTNRPVSKRELPENVFPTMGNIKIENEVKLGSSVSLAVAISNDQWSYIQWYKNQEKITEGEKYQMSDQNGIYRVNINPVELEDAGEWQCIATNAFNSTSRSCLIQPIVPQNYRYPEFIQELQAILNGDRGISFECKVISYPPPQLHWFKDGEELLPGDVHQIDSVNSLGKYSCLAHNCMGEATSTTELTETLLNNSYLRRQLELKSPPEFAKKLESMEVFIGESFLMSVKVLGALPIQVTWFLNGIKIESQEGRELFSNGNETYCIKINSVSPNDEGEWTCLTENSFGSSSTSSTLKCQIPLHYKEPKFLEPLRVTLEKGVANIICKVIGIPRPDLRWYKDGVQLSPGDVYMAIQLQHKTSFGTYTCEAINCMGSVRSSASIFGTDDFNEQENSSDYSLSTIYEERTSEISIYEIPASEFSESNDEYTTLSFSGSDVFVTCCEGQNMIAVKTTSIKEDEDESSIETLDMFEDALLDFDDITLDNNTVGKNDSITEENEAAGDSRFEFCEKVYDSLSISINGNEITNQPIAEEAVRTIKNSFLMNLEGPLTKNTKLLKNEAEERIETCNQHEEDLDKSRDFVALEEEISNTRTTPDGSSLDHFKERTPSMMEKKLEEKDLFQIFPDGAISYGTYSKIASKGEKEAEEIQNGIHYEILNTINPKGEEEFLCKWTVTEIGKSYELSGKENRDKISQQSEPNVFEKPTSVALHETSKLKDVKKKKAERIKSSNSKITEISERIIDIELNNAFKMANGAHYNKQIKEVEKNIAGLNDFTVAIHKHRDQNSGRIELESVSEYGDNSDILLGSQDIFRLESDEMESGIKKLNDWENTLESKESQFSQDTEKLSAENVDYNEEAFGKTVTNEVKTGFLLNDWISIMLKNILKESLQSSGYFTEESLKTENIVHLKETDDTNDCKKKSDSIQEHTWNLQNSGEKDEKELEINSKFSRDSKEIVECLDPLIDDNVKKIKMFVINDEFENITKDWEKVQSSENLISVVNENSDPKCYSDSKNLLKKQDSLHYDSSLKNSADSYGLIFSDVKNLLSLITEEISRTMKEVKYENTGINKIQSELKDDDERNYEQYFPQQNSSNGSEVYRSKVAGEVKHAKNNNDLGLYQHDETLIATDGNPNEIMEDFCSEKITLAEMIGIVISNEESICQKRLNETEAMEKLEDMPDGDDKISGDFFSQITSNNATISEATYCLNKDVIQISKPTVVLSRLPEDYHLVRLLISDMICNVVSKPKGKYFPTADHTENEDRSNKMHDKSEPVEHADTQKDEAFSERNSFVGNDDLSKENLLKQFRNNDQMLKKNSEDDLKTKEFSFSKELTHENGNKNVHEVSFKENMECIKTKQQEIVMAENVTNLIVDDIVNIVLDKCRIRSESLKVSALENNEKIKNGEMKIKLERDDFQKGKVADMKENFLINLVNLENTANNLNEVILPMALEHKEYKRDFLNGAENDIATCENNSDANTNLIVKFAETKDDSTEKKIIFVNFPINTLLTDGIKFEMRGDENISRVDDNDNEEIDTIHVHGELFAKLMRNCLNWHFIETKLFDIVPASVLSADPKEIKCSIVKDILDAPGTEMSENNSEANQYHFSITNVNEDVKNTKIFTTNNHKNNFNRNILVNESKYMNTLEENILVRGNSENNGNNSKIIDEIVDINEFVHNKESKMTTEKEINNVINKKTDNNLRDAKLFHKQYENKVGVTGMRKNGALVTLTEENLSIISVDYNSETTNETKFQGIVCCPDRFAQDSDLSTQIIQKYSDLSDNVSRKTMEAKNSVENAATVQMLPDGNFDESNDSVRINELFSHYEVHNIKENSEEIQFDQVESIDSNLQADFIDSSGVCATVVSVDKKSVSSPENFTPVPKSVELRHEIFSDEIWDIQIAEEISEIIENMAQCVVLKSAGNSNLKNWNDVLIQNVQTKAVIEDREKQENKDVISNIHNDRKNLSVTAALSDLRDSEEENKSGERIAEDINDSTEDIKSDSDLICGKGKESEQERDRNQIDIIAKTSESDLYSKENTSNVNRRSECKAISAVGEKVTSIKKASRSKPILNYEEGKNADKNEDKNGLGQAARQNMRFAHDTFTREIINEKRLKSDQEEIRIKRQVEIRSRRSIHSKQILSATPDDNENCQQEQFYGTAENGPESISDANRSEIIRSIKNMQWKNENSTDVLKKRNREIFEFSRDDLQNNSIFTSTIPGGVVVKKNIETQQSKNNLPIAQWKMRNSHYDSRTLDFHKPFFVGIGKSRNRYFSDFGHIPEVKSRIPFQLYNVRKGTNHYCGAEFQLYSEYEANGQICRLTPKQDIKRFNTYNCLNSSLKKSSSYPEKSYLSTEIKKGYCIMEDYVDKKVIDVLLRPFDNFDDRKNLSYSVQTILRVKGNVPSVAILSKPSINRYEKYKSNSYEISDVYNKFGAYRIRQGPCADLNRASQHLAISVACRFPETRKQCLENRTSKSFHPKKKKAENIPLTLEAGRTLLTENDGIPYFIKKPRSLNAYEEDTVIIYCEVGGLPKPELIWKKNWLRLECYWKDSRISTYYDGVGHFLSIQNVCTRDTGAYSIIAKNSEGSALVVVSLQVKTKKLDHQAISATTRYCPLHLFPKVIKPLRDIYCEEGETVIFQCEIIAEPLPTIIWRKNKQIIHFNNCCAKEIRDSLIMLHISNTTSNDSGLYTCLALNEVGRSSTSAHLLVNEKQQPRKKCPPMLLCAPQNQMAECGDNVEFSCAISGHPDTSVVWRKNTLQINSSPKHVLVSVEDRRILQVIDVSASDVGLYTVTLENEMGRIESSARLDLITKRSLQAADQIDCPAKPEDFEFKRVQDRPRFSKQLGYVKANKDDEVKFTCDVRSSSTPTIRWLRNNENVLCNNRIHDCFNGRTAQLYIQQSSFEDSGIYSCVASNEYGETSTYGYLEIFPIMQNNKQKIPVFYQKLRSHTVFEGEETKLEVKVKGVEPITITWSHNAVPVSELTNTINSHRDDYHALHIKDASIHDEGFYSCEARNLHGVSKCFCELQVKPMQAKDATLCKPHILSCLDPIFVRNSSCVSATVRFWALPLPSVHWFIDGEPLVNSNNYQITALYDCNILTIKNAALKHGSQIECRVENSLGYMKQKTYIYTDENSPYVDDSEDKEESSDLKRDLRKNKAVLEDEILIEHANENGISQIPARSLKVLYSNPLDGDQPQEKPDHTQSISNSDNLTSECFITLETKNSFKESTEKDEEKIWQSATLVPNHEVGSEVNSEVDGCVSQNMIYPDCGILSENITLTGANGIQKMLSVEQFHEIYEVCEQVGKGHFGVVHKVVSKDQAKSVYAAKFIKCIQERTKEKFRIEAEILGKMKHPKVLFSVASFETPKQIIIVMQYITGGELFERVAGDDFTLTERDCIGFVRQICDGVRYMHDQNVVHLDLKPENIMCKSPNSDNIVIIDFGLAQYLQPGENIKVLLGTPEFVAPEIVNFEPVNFASDMWSVGVICYVLLSGISPFIGSDDAATFANITKGDFSFDDPEFEPVSDHAKDFISNLLLKKKEKRMLASRCLLHPWLQRNSDDHNVVALSTTKLKKFLARRKWHKTGNALRALSRMINMRLTSAKAKSDSMA